MYQKRNNELEILALFLGDYLKELYLREISKLAGIPLKTTQNAILKLEKNKILKSVLRGKNKYFSLNLDNIATKFYLAEAEINKTVIFMLKYPLFKMFIKELNADMLLIVFGSFAKFKADKDSDLDLFMAGKEKEEIPFHLLAYNTHKIELSKKDFINSAKKQEPLIMEIQENHIILNNHSLYINIMWKYYGSR